MNNYTFKNILMVAYSVLEAYRLCVEDLYCILDIRTEDEYFEKHPDVPKLFHIPEKEIKERWVGLPLNVKILVFDKDGENANEIANYLNELDFDADFIVGGMNEWELKALPVSSLSEKCAENCTCMCTCGRK